MVRLLQRGRLRDLLDYTRTAINEIESSPRGRDIQDASHLPPWDDGSLGSRVPRMAPTRR